MQCTLKAGEANLVKLHFCDEYLEEVYVDGVGIVDNYELQGAGTTISEETIELEAPIGSGQMLQKAPGTFLIQNGSNASKSCTF